MQHERKNAEHEAASIPKPAPTNTFFQWSLATGASLAILPVSYQYLPFNIFLFITAVVAITCFNSVHIVRTGTCVHVEFLGRYSRTISEGLHFVVPFIESTVEVKWEKQEEKVNKNGQMTVEKVTFKDCAIPLNECSYDFPPIEVTTKDRLRVSVNGVLFYRVVDAFNAAYNINDLWNGIGLLIGTALRNAISALDYEDAKVSQGAIREAVLRDFVERSKRWGIEIVEIDIQSIDASDRVAEAAEAVVVAERNMQADLKKQEAESKAALLRQQTEADMRILRAKTTAEEALIEAEARRAREEMEAKSEASRLRALIEAGATPEFLLQREYSQAWKSISMNAKQTLVVPYEAARFLGASHLIHSTNTQAPSSGSAPWEHVEEEAHET